MYKQSLVRLSSRRAFSSTLLKPVHFKEGVYSNLPFKVLNRRIPYAFLHFGFFGLGFAVPFIAVYVQLKKHGNI